ncbi:hypothetical protein A3K86_08370 [Photobacterium jeanii]|uniref:DUF4145 domain-containing protein n=1 Tax=Photobacterium jeanii TaxID=858640 RepID=A0A178KK46_9GAMM|nr:DUF4145 domain-containing protein [Photobacterium jeanii]OAN16942.1 hypothetical protein A3K86_08370 [Photobacterium jeanii]PST88232.1 DUF4145 domain-containing protein [Photobacterium jeanii]
MANIEMVVTKTRRIEHLLREHYHAEGKGLHQLISSCETRLPHEIIPKLRFIASVRNKVVHEDGYKLDDKKGFVAACKLCEKELTPRSGRFIWGVALFVLFAFTALAVWFYSVNWHNINLTP